MTIRNLFDLSKGKGLDRRIEKVITYATAQDEFLKAEISEYVVTDGIEEQFRKLLDRMQLAMESGSENEIGVWVSGFYGSGKSSFTKYLGFAFDERKQIDGQQAIDALKTNKSFGNIGVSLRDVKPSIDVLARAAQRLTELSGEAVIPLEQDISRAAVKQFTHYQRDYGPFAEKLASLNLPRADRLRSLNQELADVLLTDASDAPERLGGEESALYHKLKWAGEVKRALENGLETTIRSLQTHQREITALPDTGVPGALRQDLAEDLELLSQRLQKDDFYRHTADLNTLLTTIQTKVRNAVHQLIEQQKQRVKEGAADLERLPEWQELTEEERNNVRARLDQLIIDPVLDRGGLRQLLARNYDLNTTISEQKERIRQQAEERRRQRIVEKRHRSSVKEVSKLKATIPVPAVVTSREQLEELLQQLQALREKLTYYSQIEISIEIQDKVQD